MAPSRPNIIDTLKFGGNNMKNSMMKNLTKSMADYGEMLNKVGC